MSTQIPDPVSVGNRVEVVTPNAAMQPVGASLQIQQTLPAYKHQNPVSFRNRLVQDSAFRSEFIDQVYQQRFQENPEMAERATANPQGFELAKRKTEANILNEIYPELSSGEEIGDAIARRGAELSGRDFDQSKTAEYLRTISILPERFESFGITSNGKLIDQYQSRPEILGQLIRSDDELRNEVYKGRFDIFRATLSESQNQHGIDTNDPDSIAKAFAVFENYGSEGLTKYVNYFQRYNPNIPLEEQDNEVVLAHRFFNSPDFQGREPSQVVDRFIGSVDSEDGYLSYEPQRMVELDRDIPVDYNAFTRFFHEENGTNVLVNAALRGTFDAENEEGVLEFSPISTQNVEEFNTFVRDGVKTRKTANLMFDIMRLAREGNAFTTQDLVSTVAVHASPQQGERGAIEYIFNPDELPDQAKIAYEALQMDNALGGGASLFRDAGDGMVAIEPGRQQRVQEQVELLAGYSIVNRERVPVFDDETGAVVGYETNFNPRLLSFDYPGLLFGRSLQFLSNYMITPMTKATAKVLEYMNQDDVAESITSSDFLSKFREFGDYDPYQDVGDFFGGGGGVLLMTDLGAYITASMNIGRAITATAGAAMGAAAGRAATSAASTRFGLQAGKYLRSLSEPTRWQAQSAKIGNILTRAGKSSSNIFINTEVGAGVLEAAGGARMSMLSNPLFDNVLEKVGFQTDIEKTYAASNNITRIGLDFFSSIGIGFGLDNLFAGVKYAGNVVRVSKGKTARGLVLDTATGDYIKANEAVFAPEWRRFMYEATNGLQEMPLGTLADAQANMFLGKALVKNPENIETLEEALGVMNHHMGDLFTTLREDIDKTVRYWDNELGGKIHYTDEVVARRTDELFQETVDKIADGIVATYRYQDPDKRDLIMTMAERMRNHGTKVKAVSYNTPNGPKYLLDSYEANTVAAKHPNSVITEVVQADGSVRYSVNIVDEGFWGVEMANALIKRYTKANADDVVERNVRRLGYGDNPTSEQAKVLGRVATRAEEVIGREVVHSNQRGYIVDFDARGNGLYTIRGIDGVERKAFITDEMMDVAPIRDREGINPLEVVKRNAAQRAQAYANATEVTVPRRRPLQLTAGDPEAREELGNIISTIEGLNLQQLDEEFLSGFPDVGYIQLARYRGVPEMRIREAIAKNIDPEIQKSLKKIESLRKDKRIKSEETRQARIADEEMRIDDLQAKKADYNQSVSDLYGGSTKDLADEAVFARYENQPAELAQRYRDARNKARRMRNAQRQASGGDRRIIEPSEGPFRKTFGQGEAFIKQLVREASGRLAVSLPSIRKLVMMLGSDNNAIDNIAKISYNKGKIKPIQSGNIKKHTAVIHEGDVYMARQSIKEAEIKNGTATPSVWVPNKDGTLSMNPYWARVNRNVTISDVNGKLQPVVFNGNGKFGKIYRAATATDSPGSIQYLNVQKPYQTPRWVTDDKIDIDRIMSENIDAIRKERDGMITYEIFNEADQVFSARKLSDFQYTTNLRSVDLESQGVC